MFVAVVVVVVGYILVDALLTRIEERLGPPRVVDEAAFRTRLRDALHREPA